MTSKTFASRGARAVIVILAAIALAGEASATSWKAIPVRDAVSKADAIVRGKVASVEPLDVNSDVVVVEVAAVLKGDMPKDATIRLVATHGGARRRAGPRAGEDGIGRNLCAGLRGGGHRPRPCGRRGHRMPSTCSPPPCGMNRPWRA